MVAIAFKALLVNKATVYSSFYFAFFQFLGLIIFTENHAGKSGRVGGDGREREGERFIQIPQYTTIFRKQVQNVQEF